MILNEHGNPIDGSTCEHKNIKVEFDKIAAAGLDAYEVRRRWPRFCGRCPDCGYSIIQYASAEHYTYGDW